MTWDHDRVQELLAGHTLGGLDRDEAELAERAAAEHLPGCDTCRDAFEGFRAVAGDLALAAPIVPPPDTLRARLGRSIRRPPAATRWGGWVAAGVAVMLLGALSGWNVLLTGRLNEAETRQRWLVDAVGSLGDPGSGVVSLQGAGRGTIRVLIAPGTHRMYVVGSGMRKPREGAYHVWLVRAERTWSAGTLLPRHGVAMLRVEEDPATVDQVMVTHETADEPPTPTASPVAQAVLATPAASPTPGPSPSPHP